MLSQDQNFKKLRHGFQKMWKGSLEDPCTFKAKPQNAILKLIVICRKILQKKKLRNTE